MPTDMQGLTTFEGMNEQKTILIVEDEAPNVRTYIEFFKDKPFKILHAANGRIALDLIEQSLPDLIIMDWNMPEMSGIEATRRLQEKGITDDIPIIIATGVMTSPEDLQMALDHGAYDYIRKPFDDTELTARINSSLRLSNTLKTVKGLRKIEKELMDEKLFQQERELSIALNMKDNTARFLEELRSDLDRIAKTSSAMTQGLIQELSKKMNGFTGSDRTWHDFKVHFQNVHPRFFERLQADFRNLTTNEARLCAYIKMGMGNKEIANILGISPNSVKKNITRLKHKMELEEEMTLRDFIMDL